eukprot:9028863-Pyramimonas_sp.AAC.1
MCIRDREPSAPAGTALAAQGGPGAHAGKWGPVVSELPKLSELQDVCIRPGGPIILRAVVRAKDVWGDRPNLTKNLPRSFNVTVVQCYNSTA